MKTMKTIYKYALSPCKITTHNIPEGGIIRHIGKHHTDISMWVEVTTPAPEERRTFTLFGTGHEIPEEWGYIGTVFDGPFVWHVHERTT